MALDLQAAYKNIANLRIGLPITASITAATTIIPGTLTVTGGLVSSALTINGTLSPLLAFTGSTSGTVLQFVNTIATINSTLTTTAFSALGITPGTALEYYALNAHRWWTGSTGTTSGALSMQLAGTNLAIAGNLQVLGSTVFPNSAYGQFNLINVSQSWNATPITFSIGTGNMTLNAPSQILIPYTGCYCVSLNFDVSPAVISELVIYVNTQSASNRLIDRYYTNGSSLPDVRLSTSVTVTLNAGDLLSCFLTTNGTMQVANTYSRGLTVALLNRIA